MVSATGPQDTNHRVKPIPIGNDNLGFKHDLAIMEQLDKNGKSSFNMPNREGYFQI